MLKEIEDRILYHLCDGELIKTLQASELKSQEIQVHTREGGRGKWEGGKEGIMGKTQGWRKRGGKIGGQRKEGDHKFNNLT